MGASPFRNYGINFRYAVTGTLTPVAAGTYDTVGMFGDDGYAKHQTLSYYIWFDVSTGKWTISGTLGVLGAWGWTKNVPFTTITGTYTLYGTATGVPTVAEAVFP